MSVFLEKFNTITQNRFDYLKLTDIDVHIRSKLVVVNFIYPESRQKEAVADCPQIKAAVQSALNTKAASDVKLTVSHFDKDYFYSDFLKFLKKYPSVSSDMSEGDLIVSDEPGNYKVTLKLNSHILDYCNEKNVLSEINDYLSTYYCDTISFSIELKNAAGEAPELIFKKEEVKTKLDDESGRYIIPQNVDELIGPIIYDKAVYIEDAVKPKERLVVCGTIVQFDEHIRKPRPEDTEERKFYRMAIEDFTGKMEFLYFPTKYSKDKITLLQLGKDIVTRGTYETDKRDPDKLVYIVKDISYCTLPKDFKINRIRRTVEKDYITVRPQEYVKTSQGSLFEMAAKKKTPEFLKGKTFVVFDLETTGLNASRGDRIIEVAGVKIVDGVFKETFSTFVDPKIPIPQKITDLTGINDYDVSGKPEINDVMIDFYKFTEGAVLVAQNIQFDYSFISAYGKPLNIYFENKQYDTLLLARKYCPDLKKFSLDKLTEHLGVELNNAHRAINDAIATAEVFVKLAEKMA